MKAKCKKVRQKYYYKVLALRDIITGEKVRQKYHTRRFSRWDISDGLSYCISKKGKFP